MEGMLHVSATSLGYRNIKNLSRDFATKGAVINKCCVKAISSISKAVKDPVLLRGLKGLNEIGGVTVPTSPTRVTAACSVLCFHSVHFMFL